ncbi:MAG: DbpA RNA binding domain-containing protein [Alkalispirochaeta sp.]
MQSFGCPEWVASKRSGVIVVDSDIYASFGRNLSEMIRSVSSAGSSPETLVLASDPDKLVADGGPTAVSPTRIIDLLRRDELSLERLRRVVAFIPAGERTQFAADLGFILTKTDTTPQLMLLTTTEDNADLLENLPSRHWKTSDLRHQLDEHEGSITMAGSRSDEYIENPDELKARLKDLVRRIHDEEDPHQMTAYKRFVKRNVSIFSRAYLTAYLVKTLINEGELPPPSRTTSKTDKPRRGRRGSERKTAEKRSPTGGAAANDSNDAVTGNVAPEDRQTLFVSVGKNRRVYPKDFVALFAEIDGVEGDDIGQIKILDNYSFVEVDKSVADVIIERYDGYDFRGRKLTVNFARNKKD